MGAKELLGVSQPCNKWQCVGCLFCGKRWSFYPCTLCIAIVLFGPIWHMMINLKLTSAVCWDGSLNDPPCLMVLAGLYWDGARLLQSTVLSFRQWSMKLANHIMTCQKNHGLIIQTSSLRTNQQTLQSQDTTSFLSLQRVQPFVLAWSKSQLGRPPSKPLKLTIRMKKSAKSGETSTNFWVLTPKMSKYLL